MYNKTLHYTEIRTTLLDPKTITSIRGEFYEMAAITFYRKFKKDPNPKSRIAGKKGKNWKQY